ncbi:MAG: TRAP transporter substrate-binding protein [Desulfobacteraceae bacterium]|nr:MAG: TRAP transporter substrate-binding protein [Desulfobacteraceae bacterium]
MKLPSKSSKLCFFAAAAAVLLVSIPLVHAEKLKLAHTMSVNDTMHEGTVKFAELVKQKTNGEITVDVFPASQLGNDKAIIQGARMGSVDISMTGNPFYTGTEAALNVLDLPYLFRDFDHVYQVLDGPIGEQIGALLEKHGLKELGFMEIGFRNVTNSKRQIRKPADFQGIKIRVTPNPAHVQAFQILGAVPTPMAFGEVYMALKTGTVDGQENPITLIHGQKFYEVQKFLSLTYHAYSTSHVTMNLKKFESLKPEHQKALVESMKEASAYHRKLNRRLEDTLLKEMQASGLQVELEPDRKAIAEVVQQKTQEKYAEKFGWDLVEKIKSAGK